MLSWICFEFPDDDARLGRARGKPAQGRLWAFGWLVAIRLVCSQSLVVVHGKAMDYAIGPKQ